ncbi:hypothetical protein L208DRAFT_1551549 [Tricholoma matsutake]|nr:hypothetical protein L208DRAFT_1551549 [Tricholoma matsutake 945]
MTRLKGYRVGRVRTIFSLPETSIEKLFVTPIPDRLAYVEWYTPIPHHGLHKISVMKDSGGGQICSIVPISNIKRTVHLFPNFGAHIPPPWTSSTVLDECDIFFVNIFTDHRHLYRTLYLV